MKADEIRQVVFEELGNLAPETDPATVAADADLRETFDLDSMDFLNLIIALHERLAVDIPETDYAELRTIGSVIEYLSAKTGG
jgi:acyl carrier protein